MTQTELLQMVVNVLESSGIPYMVVGSFASTVYGEPRFTQDIDIVIDLKPEQVQSLCNAFSPDEFYVSQQAALEAVQRRKQFNVVHPKSGNKIDFMIARADPWGKTQLARRRQRSFLPGLMAYAASPEDVILAKMIYYREGQSEKHTRDITGMLRMSASEIDQQYISEWADKLALTSIWKSILMRLEESRPSEEAR